MKTIVLSLLLAAVPSVLGESHEAVVITEVSVETMKDCSEFTIKGVAHKVVDGNHRFGIILECKPEGVSL